MFLKVIAYILCLDFLKVSISSILTIFPCLIIPTRLQVFSTSSNICEDIKIVLPRLFSSIRFTNSFCINGSNPLVGSSKIKISGSCIKATTMPTFCFIPLDIFLILHLGSSSKRLISSFALSKFFIPR